VSVSGDTTNRELDRRCQARRLGEEDFATAINRLPLWYAEPRTFLLEISFKQLRRHEHGIARQSEEKQLKSLFGSGYWQLVKARLGVTLARVPRGTTGPELRLGGEQSGALPLM